MTVFSKEEAAKQAIELVDTALAAGLIKDVVPCSYNHPDKSGEETAQFLGGLIRGLTQQLSEL